MEVVKNFLGNCDFMLSWTIVAKMPLDFVDRNAILANPFHTFLHLSYTYSTHRSKAFTIFFRNTFSIYTVLLCYLITFLKYKSILS